MSKPDGGPVFPSDCGGQYVPQSVMSMREYFAASAPRQDLKMALEDHSSYLYRYSDAMIAERDK